jgi:hypothetical protein
MMDTGSAFADSFLFVVDCRRQRLKGVSSGMLVAFPERFILFLQ